MPAHNRPILVGSRSAPYQPGCGDTSVAKGGCFSHYRASDLLDRWQNITKVRKAVFDPSPPTVVVDENGIPFPRFDEAQYALDNVPDDCGDLPPGSCGGWIVNGDKNGPSTRVVDDALDDIYGCAGNDETHTGVDHNCFEKSGTTDQRTCHKAGAAWVLARKSWPGSFAFNSPEWNPNVNIDWPSGDDSLYAGGTPDFSTSPDQTRYLTRTAEITYDTKEFDGTVHTTHCERTVSVDRYSGIRTLSGNVNDVDAWPGWSSGTNVFTAMLTLSNYNVTTASDYIAYKTQASYFAGGTGFTTSGAGNVWTVVNDGGTLKVEVTLDFGGGSFGLIASVRDVDTDPWREVHFFQFEVGATSLSYFESVNYDDPDGLSADGTRYRFSFTCDLDDAYTAAECFGDWQDAIGAWDLSDKSYPLRLDGQLANGPLCVFDEVGPTEPGLDVENCTRDGTMDDYEVGLVDDENSVSPGDPGYLTTWAQRAWLDPANYVWTNSSGGFAGVPDEAGGNLLVTPVRSGEVVSHTQPGSARHFWFNYLKYQRVEDEDLHCFQWLFDKHGGFSTAPLPETAMRWMNNLEAQYDADNCNPSIDAHGNFPQSWFHQEGGVLTGCKYVEAKEIWPSVDFARPHTRDKFAIDNPTACWIKEANESDPDAIIFSVRATMNAHEPLATDGTQVGDTIIVTGGTAPGIYLVTGISGPVPTDDGLSEGWIVNIYEITVGPKLDDLPTGFEYGDERDADDYLGSLRWWSAPGIAGRVQVSISPAVAGEITITPSPAQPYLRTGAVVDVCDAGMGVLAASVTLTRVDDSTFTATHATISGAAYIVPHVLYNGTTPGTKYYFHETMPKRTFVKLTWTFNPRATDPDYPSPPGFYAETPGCLDLSLSQTCIPFTPCSPAMVGHVPFTSGSPTVDEFENHELAAMPGSFPFDSAYGAHVQQAVETTMPDPFWQTPFAPDGDKFGADTVRWNEDDGTGQADFDETSEDLHTIHHRFFAHHPLVEARSSVPSTFGPARNESPPALPAGVTLFYDTAVNDIAPPYYPHGIPIGSANGAYGEVWRPYMLWNNVRFRSGGRFYNDYIRFVIW